MAAGKNVREKNSYHHGDLRAALLEAAEAELGEKGIEGFTLRGCAKRAGVSHAAPAHHFGDATGLLTALAAVGFRRFVETQAEIKETAASRDARGMQLAAGVGYVTFALKNPALFRLMFSSDRKNAEDANLQAAAGAAYRGLVADVSKARGAAVTSPGDDPDVIAAWAMVHGLADLMISGRISPDAAGPDRHRAFVESVIERALPERK